MFFDLQCSYFLAVINLLFNQVEVWVVYCKTHDKPTWLNAWLWSSDYKEKVTISLTVFTVESTGSIEGVEEADEEAGERGADWKALTGTLKNYLFFFFSSNAVKLGFHGSRRKCKYPASSGFSRPDVTLRRERNHCEYPSASLIEPPSSAMDE